MKHHILNYVLNVAIALAVLSGGNLLYNQAKTVYYRNADINNFFVVGEMIAQDICEGDENQNISSTRIVKGTDVGYHARVTRELWRIGDGKVFEETVFPFSEVAANGDSKRIQQLPTNLPAGQYQWTLYITINVFGQDREVIPPMVSNIFNIYPKDECIKDTL